ncbi:transcription initiation factor IIB [Candidatus Nanohalovita haloferacivicina]|uniref:transcription initiation factor IIB n=1 Tax=Candidatus Nanohalovita haloferacivicina TaxID=2978046 RepID=UPI00325FBAED|nr:Transcription initiation factor TFIIB [Candidatus Nanohalobia archaeon BNXNv]
MGEVDVDCEDARFEPEKDREEEVFSCPNCGSTDFVENSAKAELICRDCGTVVDENRVEESASPRAFSAEERKKKARTGSPITYTKAGKGIRTSIGKGGEMRGVAPNKRGQYYRMKKWQNRIGESKDKKMQTALREIGRLVDVLNLPQTVKEEASRLYEKAIENDLIKGRRIERVSAALVYIVARNQRIPRTMKEVADESGVDKRKLGQTYRYIAKELELGIKPVKPEDFLPRFSEELGISGETQAQARKYILDARKENLLAGRSPGSIVAAAIYLASEKRGEKVTQTAIADTVGVTEVTVRKGYRDLMEGLEIEDEE